jgi:methionine sulfoxide reductase catalytic subunit
MRILPSDITPRDIYLNRRSVLAGAGVTLAGWALGQSHALAESGPKLATVRLPAARNSALSVTDEPTAQKIATTYNNFYEFGTGKADPARNSGKFRTRPWTIEIAGEVMKPRMIGIEDLQKMALEERVYRFRCVEAWSMVVPWIGISFNEIAKLVEPTSKAKYVTFTTAVQPDTMPYVDSKILDWPYIEGLRIDEAMHPLTLLTLGAYGETLLNQNGAPVRLIVPWKYGFKSGKSVVRIDFVEQQPVTAWMRAGPSEYGFYSNVNPAVDHPRWSQKRERLLPALFASKETLPFNGYGDQVASLYAGMDLARYF